MALESGCPHHYPSLLSLASDLLLAIHVLGSGCPRLPCSPPAPGSLSTCSFCHNAFSIFCVR